MSTRMVHWNLHRNIWSVKARNGPVRHAKQIVLVDCEFLVWQGGRKRVLREKKKSVHAFVKGQLAQSKSMKQATAPLIPVSYNPYRDPDNPGTFYRKDTGAAVAFADRVLMLSDGSVWAENPR